MHTREFYAYMRDMIASDFHIYPDIEDECSICCQLLYKPVTTFCGHTFCVECVRTLIRKAHIPRSTHPIQVPFGIRLDLLFEGKAADLVDKEFSCPLCRRTTNAIADPVRIQQLEEKYLDYSEFQRYMLQVEESWPLTEEEKREEEEGEEEEEENADFLTVLRGNSATPWDHGEAGCWWRFAVQLAHKEIVEEVQVVECRKTGNQSMTFYPDIQPGDEFHLAGDIKTDEFSVTMVLKESYEWMPCDERIDSRTIRFRWALDCTEHGSRCVQRFPFQKREDWEDWELPI